jgi:uncharacterized protein YukE
MSKPLQLIPPDMQSAAAAFRALGDEVAQTLTATQREWRRLDAGWRSYAKSGVDAEYDALSLALQRKERMMRAIGEALAASAQLLSESDTTAAALFGVDALTQPRGPIIEPPWGSGVNPGLPGVGGPGDGGLIPLLPETGDDLAINGPQPPGVGLQISSAEQVFARVGDMPVTAQGKVLAQFGPSPTVIYDTEGKLVIDLGVLGLYGIGSVAVNANGLVGYSSPPAGMRVIDLGPRGKVTIHITPSMTGVGRPHPDTRVPTDWIGTAITVRHTDPAGRFTGGYSGVVRIYPPPLTLAPTPTPQPTPTPRPQPKETGPGVPFDRAPNPVITPGAPNGIPPLDGQKPVPPELILPTPGLMPGGRG